MTSRSFGKSGRTYRNLINEYKHVRNVHIRYLPRATVLIFYFSNKNTLVILKTTFHRMQKVSLDVPLRVTFWSFPLCNACTAPHWCSEEKRVD